MVKRTQAFIRRASDARLAVQLTEKAFAEMIEAAGKATEEALLAGAEIIKKEAQRRTPVKTGNLRDSAVVSSVNTPDGFVASVGFEADYAVFVHERLDLQHKTGEAKFLQNAAEAKESEVLEIVSKIMRRKFR